MLDELVWTEGDSDDSVPGGAVAKLTKLAGQMVNDIPLPKCWDWRTEQVIEWLNNIVKLPQYKDCFERNFINGRRLLLLEDDSFPKIGIYDYSHIKIVMREVRNLSGFETVDWNRSISLPAQSPMRLYVQYRVPTGPIREATTRVEYFNKINILNSCKACNSDSHHFPCTLFGLSFRRKNVYARIEFPRENFNQLPRALTKL